MLDFTDDAPIVDAIWVHKYRPKKLEDIKLEKDQYLFLNRCLQKCEIPHLFLHGPPGSGKTTSAMVIRDVIIKDRADVLELNGSIDRGINVVREQIEPYLKTPPMASNHKIIFIDEFDFMTKEAQESLRHIFEKYEKIGRFLCTGNYASKVEPALISRFQKFEMKTIPEEFAVEYCEYILKSEKVEYEKKNVELVVKTLLPDIRQIVNTLQQNTIDNKLSGISRDKIITIDKKMVGIICRICDSIGKPEQTKVINSSIPELENSFSEGEPDYIAIYTELSRSGIPPWAKITINKYCNKHNSCAIPMIHFMSMVFDVIQAGKTYYKVFGIN